MGNVADRVHRISHWPKAYSETMKRKGKKEMKIKGNENDVAKNEKNELKT